MLLYFTDSAHFFLNGVHCKLCRKKWIFFLVKILTVTHSVKFDLEFDDY